MKLPTQPRSVERTWSGEVPESVPHTKPSDCKKCRNEDRERCCPEGLVVVCGPTGYSECVTPELARLMARLSLINERQ